MKGRERRNQLNFTQKLFFVVAVTMCLGDISLLSAIVAKKELFFFLKDKQK
jgi:hypothetical protein